MTLSFCSSFVTYIFSKLRPLHPRVPSPCVSLLGLDSCPLVLAASSLGPIGFHTPAPRPVQSSSLWVAVRVSWVSSPG